MRSPLTHQTFIPHMGERFDIALGNGQTLALVLAQVTPWGDAPVAEREARRPFSLLFRNERLDAYLPQQIYSLEHPTLGPLELFLVPLGPDGGGMRYEAVFT